MKPPLRGVTFQTIALLLVFICVALVSLFRPSPELPVPSSQSLEAIHGRHASTSTGTADTPKSANSLPSHEVDVILARMDQRIRENPLEARYHLNKIEFALTHRPTVAAEECNRILGKQPDHYFALTHMAAAQMALGRLNKALHFAAKAVQSRDIPESRILLANLYLQQGRKEVAARQYEKALEMDPSNQIAAFGLAACRSRGEGTDLPSD